MYFPVIQATNIFSLSVETSFMYLPFSQCWHSEWKIKLFQRLLQPPICCWRASIWLPRQPVTWKRWNNYCRFQISFAHHANSHILRTLDCLKWHLKMSWTPWLMRSFLASASTFTGYYLDNGFVTATDSHISDLLKLGPGRFHSWQERRNHPCLLLATLMWGINLNLSFI